MDISNINFERIILPFEASPNTATPSVEVSGKDLTLSYTTNSDEIEIGKLLFSDCLLYRVGSPNDEGFYGFGSNPKIRNDSIYYKKNFPDLDFYEFYVVTGYDWKNNQLIGENKWILDSEYSQKEGYTHYIFFMKDGTFECVAKDFRIVS